MLLSIVTLLALLPLRLAFTKASAVPKTNLAVILLF